MAKKKEKPAAKDVLQIEMKEEKNKKENTDLSKVKEELTNYIDDKIKKSFNEELDKANKKLIREKNKKILFRNVIIILLLAIIGFLLFIMYRNNYFDKFFNHENKSSDVIEKNDNKENNEKEKKTDIEEEVKLPTLDELKTKYGNLINYYELSPNSIYKEDFYKGNLTGEIKKYMTLNTIDFTTLKEEDDYNTISENTFKKIFDTLFNNGYEEGNFEYNGNKIRYLKGFDTYISTTSLKKDNDIITREIIDIKEENNNILITTVEGVIRNNKLYNALTFEEIESYDDKSIINYQDKLNKITYKFLDSKLVELIK